ncbi:BUD32 family EKC/KEOPS complex subunit [Stutzerimonas chloritidismutans]|uniref:toluene tolerance protein n=1 Tax=Stutzerimonas chloritidismutans TaxID=203192 RepID=UPI003F177703
MRIVSADELEYWLAHGQVIERDARGPKVIALAEGDLLKIFHTRKHPLLARYSPPAQVFAGNCARLLELGVAAPVVTETFWLNRSVGLSGCLYEPLPGRSLDALIQQPGFLAATLAPLADFILDLHRKGIYFRSLHLGNILEVESERFGLIDVLDLQFRRAPLNRRHVERNFIHLRSYLQRRKIEFPFDQLLEIYAQRAGMKDFSLS